MGAGHSHSILVAMIAHILLSYVLPNDYGTVHTGEPGYHLDFDPDTVRCPDVAWIAPGRVPEGTRGFPNLAPDLAIEVKSPSNSNPEMAAKAWMWLSYGSQQAWVADPERNTLTVYTPAQTRKPWARTTNSPGAICSPASPPPSGGCSAANTDRHAYNGCPDNPVIPHQSYPYSLDTIENRVQKPRQWA